MGLSSQPEKPRGSHRKNLALTVTTLAVILLVLVSLQLIPHSITVDKTPSLGVKVGSTIDWQGLAWGETRKLASDSKGTIYLAYRTQVPGMAGDKAFVDFSTDNGLTWSHLGGGPIDTMTPGTQMQRVPAISVGGNDVLQVVWNEVPNDQSGDRQIWYSRWIAGNSQSLAGHWSTPRNIPVYINGYQQAPDPKHWQEHPDILVDGLNSSRVYVVWEGTDLSNFVGVNCSSSNCSTPMFTESEDGGVHWSNYAKLVNPNGEVNSRPTITEDSYGILYVAWYATNQTVEGNAQIRWVSSIDHGKNWSQLPQLIPENYGIDQRDPSLAADSHGKVYMVWKEKGPSSPQNQNQTMYSVLSGGSWSKPVRVNPDAQNQLNPTVQVDNATNVYVGWHTGGPYQWGGDPPGAYNGAQIWLAKFNGTWSARQLTSSATNRFINLPANPMQSPSVQIAWVEGDSPHPYNIEFATLKF